MKKSPLIILIQCLVILTIVAQQDHFTLTGLTNNIPDKTQVYLMDGTTNQNVDSAIIQNNQFVFTGDAHPYKEYWVTAQYADKFEYKSIFVENEDMVFDASKSNFFNARVSGSLLQTQSDELFYLTKEWRDKWEEINHKIGQLPKTNQAQKDSLRQVRVTYEQKENDLIYQFIKDHPDYLISLKYLPYLKNYLSKKEVQPLYEAMSAEFQQTEEGTSIKVWLEESIQLNIGDKAPDFELPNLQGASKKLSNFQGKYVLLEFGASGCHPCRMENPNLLKAYKKYREKGFEILSVWLDKNKDNWEQAVAKDEMIWTSVCDLKGNNGIVPTTYNVTYIPTNYLLNPAGKVIAKDLKREKLQEKLAAIFDQSSITTSFAQKATITVDVSSLDFANTDKQVVYLSTDKLYQIGNSKSIAIEVKGLPTSIELQVLNKNKFSLLKNIWVEQNTVKIQGSISHLDIVPLSSSQSKIDKHYSAFKVGKPIAADLAFSKPYLVHLARANQFYTVSYIKEIMNNLPDSLNNYWAAKQLNTYLLDFDKIAYDPSAKQLNYLSAINRDKEVQRLELPTDKYLLLDFSVPGCAPCLTGIDRLVAFNTTYSQKLDIVMLWDGFSYEDWLGYKKKHQSKITFDNLLDENGTIFKTMDIKVFPTYMLFNPKGMLVKKWKGKLPKDISKYFK